jgi:glycosyltransferase involved in cell wall biosynthesis
MLQGVPVIASHSTGIAELVARHRCGIIIEPTAPALGAALTELAQDPVRLGEFSRLSIGACYSDLSFEVYGRSLKAAYDSLGDER